MNYSYKKLPDLKVGIESLLLKQSVLKIYHYKVIWTSYREEKFKCNDHMFCENNVKSYINALYPPWSDFKRAGTFMYVEIFDRPILIYSDH